MSSSASPAPPAPPAPREETVLVTRAGDDAAIVDLRRAGAAPEIVARHALPERIATIERDEPLWVWDDTTRWYPDLLAAGVRVRRCADLRLRRRILRRSPRIDQRLLDGPDAERWDALEPADGTDALFDLGAEDGPRDPLDEWRRQRAAVDAADDAHARRLRLLLSAESSGALVAAELTHAGLPVRAELHEALLLDSIGARPATPTARPAALEDLVPRLREALRAPDLNPDVPAQVLTALRRAGLDVADTRSWTLRRLDHPAVPLLLAYKKLARIAAANGWRWLDTWVRDGRYRPTYLPGGVVTGRWAAQGGGALSYPKDLRAAVVADEGWTFVVADVAQLEPRVLAGMSGDTTLADAGRSGDLYRGLVEKRAVATRDDAKLAMLGAMYGATSGESGRLVARLTALYPRAFGFVDDAARAGERGEIVETHLGRASPPPGGAWTEALGEVTTADPDARRRDRARWGRFTRNFVVQGTGAEWALCWMATLRTLLWDIGDAAAPLGRRPHLVLFLHDEVVVHTPRHLADATADAVRSAAERATRLMFGGFPVDLPVTVDTVDSWADA